MYSGVAMDIRGAPYSHVLLSLTEDVYTQDYIQPGDIPVGGWEGLIIPS